MRKFLWAAAALSFILACHAAKTPNYAAIKADAAKAEAELPLGSSNIQGSSQTASSFGNGGSNLVDSSLNAKIVGRSKRMKCTWVESQGVADVTSSMSPEQSKAMAISEARRMALEKVLGVRVRARDLVFQQSGLEGNDSMIQSLVQTMRQGRIIDEKVGKNGYVPSSQCPYCRYQAEVSDCVKPFPRKSDQNFWVRINLSKQHLVSGDSEQVDVSASTRCYVYLYDQAMDGSLSLIVPNDYVSHLRVGPNSPLIYPDPNKPEEEGLALVAEIPPGQKMSAETISVIASKEPLPVTLYQLRKKDDYFSLLKRLNASRYDWTDDAEPYFIYAH